MFKFSRGPCAACIAAASFSASAVLAQETPDPEFVQTWPTKAPGGQPRIGVQLVDNGLPNYLITGYWPPTNEMVRAWSTDPNQRPLGQAWVGEDWEGRGFNIYALFPEFPGGTGSNPKGNGDFEVDYQDTSADWWSYLAQVQPLIITTFSRANTSNGWELEGGNRFYANNSWTSDYLSPTRPTINEPADPPGMERWSTLPMQAIVDAVTASGANVDPFIEPIDTSAFLSNYIGYHGNWWRDTHVGLSYPGRCIIGGHIHVGRFTEINAAVTATQVTLREVIKSANSLLGQPGDLNCDGDVNFGDIDPFITALAGAEAYYAATDNCWFGLADASGDGLVNFADIDPFVALLSQ